LAGELPVIVAKNHLSGGIEEFTVRAPVVARAARAGQFVRVLPVPDGELIPLTLADWDEAQGTITLVVQGMGTSTLEFNAMRVGQAIAGIAGPWGPSDLHRYDDGSTVVFTAGGPLPPVYPIMRSTCA
jgi:glutamate synthase (NADPH/NADH) small chain